MSCVSNSRPPHRGQRRFSALDSTPVGGWSLMNFISCSVEPAESCGLLYISNQNAWHAVHTSNSTGEPSRPSSDMSVISLAQPGHFIRLYLRLAAQLFLFVTLSEQGESKGNAFALDLVILSSGEESCG